MVVWNVVLTLMFLLLIYFWEHHACKILHYRLQKTLEICDISQNVMMPQGSTWYYLSSQFSYRHASHHRIALCFVNSILVFGHIFGIRSSHFNVALEEESITCMYIYIQCTISIYFLNLSLLIILLTFGSILSLYISLL